MTCVVERRGRLALRQRAYEESKHRLLAGQYCCCIHGNMLLCRYMLCVCAPQTEYEELQQVAISNQRRDDRLAKVRGKEFSVKLEEMEVCREGDVVGVGR